MAIEFVPSDIGTLDLLRKCDTMSVMELSAALGVTGTAVRQRLTRLMSQGYVDRAVASSGRGRPAHRYSLTESGRRKSGANFADLAVALWQEIRQIKDPEVRGGLLQRIARRLVDLYADQIKGDTPVEKLQAIGDLLGERRIPVTVNEAGQLPVLTVWACPYPELAEQDRSICAVERMIFAELIGDSVRLDKCRLDEGNCLYFSIELATSH